MATLTIRDLEDGLKLKLRLRAASQNRSMEEEVRQILRAALAEPVPARGSFVARVRLRFEGLGDVQLPIEPREPIRQALEIHEPEPRVVTPSPSDKAVAKKRSHTPASRRSGR